MKVFIETERLTIRELLPSDDAGMFELDSDPDVLKFLHMEPFKDIEESRQVIARVRQQYIDHGIGRWAMVEKKTNSFVGWTGLKYLTTPMNGHVNIYDIGYRLIKRYWGKGYATESAIASRDYGFNTLKLKDIYAAAHAEHHASRKVLEKIGMKFVESFMYDGQPTNWFKISK